MIALFLTKAGLAGTGASLKPQFLCFKFLLSEGLPAENRALARHCQEHIFKPLLGQLFTEIGSSLWRLESLETHCPTQEDGAWPLVSNREISRAHIFQESGPERGNRLCSMLLG